MIQAVACAPQTADRTEGAGRGREAADCARRSEGDLLFAAPPGAPARFVGWLAGGPTHRGFPVRGARRRRLPWLNLAQAGLRGSWGISMPLPIQRLSVARLYLTLNSGTFPLTTAAIAAVPAGFLPITFFFFKSHIQFSETKIDAGQSCPLGCGWDFFFSCFL